MLRNRRIGADNTSASTVADRPPTNHPRYQSPPIQRPKAPQDQPSVAKHLGAPPPHAAPSMAASQPQRTKVTPVNSSLKAQQAKQRAELLQHAQSFLNPTRPAATKEDTPPTSGASVATKPNTVATATPSSADDKETTPKEKEASPAEKK